MAQSQLCGVVSSPIFAGAMSFFSRHFSASRAAFREENLTTKDKDMKIKDKDMKTKDEDMKKTKAREKHPRHEPDMEDDDVVQSNLANKLERARPKNPRLGIGESTLAEFTKNLEDKLQTYDEQNHATLLFSAEERRALNKTRPNLEILSSEKWPLFHTLAVSGDSIAVDRLLKLNVDVNALDKDGYSALQRAVLAKKEPVVNQLLRAKADIRICDKAGATLLHYSVQTGSINLVRSFLTCGINVNAADKYGWTPLHLAVLTGRADIVRLLLASGADKALANKNGLTALDLCFSLGRTFNAIDMAKALKRFPKEEPTVT